MSHPSPTLKTQLLAPIAAVLTWLLPGSGHLFIGERTRGIILLITITVTFWGGVAIGGVKNTVNPDQRRLWFVGQICAGGHTLAAMMWSRQLPEVEVGAASDMLAFNKTEEISVVYTAICGMLNVLIILDVLGRAERMTGGVVERAPPTAAAGKVKR